LSGSDERRYDFDCFEKLDDEVELRFPTDKKYAAIDGETPSWCL